MSQTDSKITLTRRGESWGESRRRTHEQDSELTIEQRGAYVVVSLKQGAINAPPDAPPPSGSRPESVAAMPLSPDHVRQLAAFLASLPPEEGLSHDS